VKIPIIHLTKNGVTSVCEVNGPQIHVTYSNRKLDKGEWCSECQRIWKSENPVGNQRWN
jgi:hypothetical protein